MHQFGLILGVTDGTEMVKVAITLLGGRALTWWRAVSSEGWATLGHCDWETFSARISQEFHDLHHDFRNQTKLLDLP